MYLIRNQDLRTCKMHLRIKYSLTLTVLLQRPMTRRSRLEVVKSFMFCFWYLFTALQFRKHSLINLFCFSFAPASLIQSLSNTHTHTHKEREACFYRCLFFLKFGSFLASLKICVGCRLWNFSGQHSSNHLQYVRAQQLHKATLREEELYVAPLF